jgi:hypothetical protein
MGSPAETKVLIMMMQKNLVGLLLVVVSYDPQFQRAARRRASADNAEKFIGRGVA